MTARGTCEWFGVIQVLKSLTVETVSSPSLLISVMSSLALPFWVVEERMFGVEVGKLLAASALVEAEK